LTCESDTPFRFSKLRDRRTHPQTSDSRRTLKAHRLHLRCHTCDVMGCGNFGINPLHRTAPELAATRSRLSYRGGGFLMVFVGFAAGAAP
jgi:hypothetical protein